MASSTAAELPAIAYTVERRGMASRSPTPGLSERRYGRGGRIDVGVRPRDVHPLAKLAEGKVWGVLTDQIGTPTELIAQDGSVAWQGDIDTYGHVTQTVRGTDCPFRWPGQMEDEESGLYYNLFRQYDAICGAYVSVVPLRVGAGIELFGYPADPLTYIDPFGLARKPGAGCVSEYPNDRATSSTRNYSAHYGSEREARSMARTQLGRDPVQLGPGKLRSRDGRWQYRAKADDLRGHGPGDSPHVHLERLNPIAGEVLENWHLRW